MRKLLSSPAKMALSNVENSLYQKTLTYITDLSLNLMAVKVTNHPEDFLGWCIELLDICKQRINRDLLDEEQFKPLNKLISTLELSASVSQLKMARIAPWQIFVSFIEQQTELHSLEERMRLLGYIQELKQTSLVEMNELDRLVYAGKHTTKHSHIEFDFDSEWFTSTNAAKIFHTLLSEQTNKFDEALNFIPLTGDVTPGEYQQFVTAYKQVFTSYKQNKESGEKAPLIPATRLLAMRRPDQFIALTNSKIDILCLGLGIAKFNNLDFESYWCDLIGTLRTFAWWHESEPTELPERKLWQVRAILVDLFLFADEELALNSNYVRQRDKRSKSRLNTQKPSRTLRVKLTTAEIVDQALLVDGIPDYIKDKRSTIISEVNKGKKVEHVINVMRAIFG